SWVRAQAGPESRSPATEAPARRAASNQQMLSGDGAALVSELELLFSSLARTGTGLADGALTTTQRLALIELVESGPLRLGALAERIGATDPTVSRAVDGLVECGIVERQADPDDRRAVLHLATAQGRAWVERRRG